jgi:NTE family protein
MLCSPYLRNGLRKILCLLSALTIALPAQQDSIRQVDVEGASGRPKIGLVLSGGGARGCAHVGVLQVLEELRVPVDFVVGTSMGAIVGGAYAYGLSTEELEACVVRSGGRMPWSALLMDSPSRDRESFRRKEEDLGFLVDFGLGYRDGQFRLPKGILQGQNLELELLQMLPEAHDMQSFDDLRLPFRAVAVDLATGAEVILRSGNLPIALRASMSLPGVLAPVVIDDQSLVDGGLVHNLPVSIARRHGADVMIIVDVGTPVDEAAAASVIDVSTQMLAILTQQNVDRSLALIRGSDVFLRPDLGDFSTSDFERASEAVAIGRASTLKLKSELEELSVDEKTWAQYLKRQRRPLMPIRVDDVHVENSSGLADEVLEGYLRVPLGEDLDVYKLRVDIEDLYGRGDFERVAYELVGPQEQDKDLIVEARSKSWGPTYLRLGLALEADFRGQSGFNLAGQINRREINSLGAEWRTDLQVGAQSGFNSEFFQPLSTSGTYYVSVEVGANTRELDAYSGTTRIGFYDIRVAYARASIGLFTGNWGRLRGSITKLGGDIDAEVSVPGFTGQDFDDGYLSLEYDFDTLDNAQFPERGVVGRLLYSVSESSLGATEDYEQVSGAGAAFVTAGWTTVGLLASAESALGDTLPIYRLSTLGGFLQLSGLERNSLVGSNKASVTGVVRQQLRGSMEAFGFPVYLGLSLEAGNVYEDRADLFRDLRYGGSAFLGLGTPLGPAYFAVGMVDGGDKAVYVYLGQIF